MADQPRTGVLKSKLVPNSELTEFRRTHDVMGVYPRGPNQSLVAYLEEKPPECSKTP